MLDTRMHVVFMLLIFSGVNLLAQKQCGDQLSPFISNNVIQLTEHVNELSINGKNAIPKLIDEIDNHHLVPMVLSDPTSSQMPLDSSVSCGVVAAYLIERILEWPFWQFQPGLSGNYRIIVGCPTSWAYYSVCIVNVNTHQPCSKDDLKVVKAVYQAWWEQNGNKSLDELRKDWIAGKKPLAGSIYRWY
jgi:hypothetical protein